ncbi:MAG: hypothetical protein J7L95_05950, partial [Prolixibacteraceae bacterium]|nr:hypothetical protein [Prolixibacteraceae bacterium]
MNELESFVKSESFQQLTILPITPARAQSYLHNPRALPGDVVLFLGFIDSELVAFRSLFADVAYTKTDKIRFGWCSGNWVDPRYRRKGFSERLLKEAYNDWNGKLMFTNYAPASEQLYLKTGLFNKIHRFNGVRAYLFPKTRKLIRGANKNWLTKLVFSVLDFNISFFARLRLCFFHKKNSKDYRFETVRFPDDECLQSIKKQQKDFLFNRGTAELKWIFNYPWIVEGNRPWAIKYPFSASLNSFKYYTIKIFFNNKFTGFFIFSVREGHLKTLFFHLPQKNFRETTIFLKNFSKKHKIEVVTIFNNEIAGQLFNKNFPFLRVKKYG